MSHRSPQNDASRVRSPEKSGTRELSEVVKNLGRKARSRLRDELSKRPEIQRLNSMPEPPAGGVVTKKNTETLFVKPVIVKKKSTVSRRKKRRISQRSQDRDDTSSITITFGNHANDTALFDDRMVDRWMPTISHLLSGAEESKSNVVQLHGLPVGTTPTQIRRFFGGLDPRRILVLLPLSIASSDRMEITELDACYDTPPRKGGFFVQRYEQLRVLVKFHAAPTAALAAQRSGEVMQVPVLEQSSSETNEGKEHDDDEDRATTAKGASVRVTLLSKARGTHLVKKLAVDGVPGEALDQTLRDITSKLDPMVPIILWDAAIHDLSLNVTTTKGSSTTSPPAISAAMHQFSTSPLQFAKGWTRPRNPRSKQTEIIQQLQQYQTKLSHQVDRLEQQQLQTVLPGMDPTLLQSDKVLNLTWNALDVLRHEMDRVDHAVTVAERWQRLMATRRHRAAPGAAAASRQSCGAVDWPTLQVLETDADSE